MKSIAIIGGGAAGCFCAIELKRRMPESKVTIYESQDRLLAKVAITGGGRCNLTNSFEDFRDSNGNITSLEHVYPRGHRLMKRLFNVFSPDDTIKWFEAHGVRLVTQEDGCIFPKSQDAMEIVHTLENLIRQEGIQVKTGHKITDITALKEDIKVITTGGKKTDKGYEFLSKLDIETEKPIPSLFTFEINDTSLNSLSGTVVDNATLSIPSTRFRSQGILLITDWGTSGPATLKLSSYAARFLSDSDYHAPLSINWLSKTQEEALIILKEIIAENKQKKLSSINIPTLTSRLWSHLITRAQIREDIRCAEIGSKQLNRLSATLTSDSYQITAKGRFKEEFVTCGGVSLNEIDPNTLRSKKHPGIFFAGEVLDIDAITGGFNLQAAWTTGYVAAKSIQLV
ncbi:MAG: aminoacetone oxidase family FAD-binding enzyme [Bacteroidales bacterium]|nr:aminoacetone oxidase family FAD-binding enzyme [Bacteroidales bacterium]